MQFWNIVKPILAVLVASLFSRIVVMGYLTPEQASEFTKIVMDFLAAAVPLGLAAWLAKGQTPTALIQTTAALPEVTKVATTLAIAEVIPDPAVQPATPQDKAQVAQASLH